MRFGLLGTGWWARDTQGPGRRSCPDADLVGVWGRDRAKTVALAAHLDTRPYTDVHALLADVEAVSMALPPDVQAPLAIEAAHAGRHLLLDKPLALSLNRADEVVAAVEEAGVRSVVFFTGRYQPDVEKSLQTAIAQGGWDGARVTVFVSVLNPGGVLLDSTWRVEKGALWDAGPHAISPLVPVLGPIVEVSALEGPRRTSYLLLRHEGGAVSTVATTLDAPKAAGTWSIDLHGRPGWWSLPGWNLPACDAFEHATADLHRAVTRGTDTLCDVRTARDVVAVLSAADAAIRERRTVRVER